MEMKTQILAEKSLLKSLFQLGLHIKNNDSGMMLELYIFKKIILSK